MLKYFDGGPTLNLIFLLIAILGIIIAIYYKRRIKKLVFNLQSTNLVTSYGNAIPGLTILYKDSPVPNLTLSKIAIWNLGNDVVNRTDVPELDKVRITLNKPYQFLGNTIKHISKSSNDFSIELSQDKNEVIINFDFIEGSDGLTLSLFHTGGVTDLSVNGAIKGVGQLEDYSFISSYNMGALIGKFILIKVGARKGTIVGTIVRIILAPIVFLLIIPGDTLLSIGNEKLKYKLIKKEFFLD